MNQLVQFSPDLGRSLDYGAPLELLLASPARAQLPAAPAQALFGCNAPGNQFGGPAFADGAGGSYAV